MWASAYTCDFGRCDCLYIIKHYSFNICRVLATWKCTIRERILGRHL